MIMRILIAAAFLSCGSFCQAQDTAKLLTVIRSVGPEGKGSPDAVRAWSELAGKEPAALPAILGALNGANPIAANYLRSAVDAIAERTLREGKTLPAKELEAFVLDKKNSGVGRRLAYEWLVRIDPTTPNRLLPGMLNDPGRELRRDAVAVLLDTAKALLKDDKKAAAKTAYQKALEVARDRDQVEAVAEALKELGAEVDLTEHFGFITYWHVIGPFDSTDGIGFGKIYPPDKGVDLKAAYKGKDDKNIRWTAHTSEEPLGLVDFNKVVGDVHGAVAYAHTTVISSVERPVELRAASNNAVRIYLNGKEVYFREEYHHGMRQDQHVGRGVLKAGHNEILVKVCQNEQTESWAQKWSFQLRITDDLGARVPVTVVRVVKD